MLRILKPGLLVKRAISGGSVGSKEAVFTEMVDDVLKENICSTSSTSSSDFIKFRSVHEAKKWVDSQTVLSITQMKDLLFGFSTLHDDSKISNEIIEESWSRVSKKLIVADCIPILTSLLKLGLNKTQCFRDVEQFWNENCANLEKSESVLTALIPMIHLATATNYKFSKQAEDVISTTIHEQIKTLNNPAHLLTLLLYYRPASNAWRESVYKHAVSLLPIMTVSHIIGFIRCLGLHQRRDLVFLKPAIQRITENKNLFTIQQIVDLSSVFAKLRYFDARVLRKIDIDLRKQVNQLRSWNDVSSLVDSFSRLRLGNPDSWQCLSNWVNSNSKSASPAVLSRAVGGFAVAGIDGIKPTAELLAKKMTRESATSGSAWLNFIFALALQDCLTPSLAETVLHKDFISELIENANSSSKLYIALRILKIQEVVKNKHGSSYSGPVVSKDSFGINLDDPKNVTIAKQLRFGKGVEAYHEMFVKGGLHKIAPSSYFGGSCINSAGVFIDDQVLIENGKLVTKSQWVGKEQNVVPIIFISWQHTLQNYGDYDGSNKKYLLGSEQLSIRLLEKLGQSPICIYESELMNCSTQAEKIAVLKSKLFQSKN